MWQNKERRKEKKERKKYKPEEGNDGGRGGKNGRRANFTFSLLKFVIEQLTRGQVKLKPAMFSDYLV